MSSTGLAEGAPKKMSYILGVDFDNTLVNYDEVFWRSALQMGLIFPQGPRHKESIRDTIRDGSAGEEKWQQLQAHVYGKAMDEAVLIEGVEEFFSFCKETKLDTYIISHKTEFAIGDKKVNLRTAALAWMKKNKFFDKTGLGVSEDQVYFEPTRERKINRIKILECTHFIDDLPETFLEESFPGNVNKMLYSPQRLSPLRDGSVKTFRTWQEIKDYFLHSER